MTIEERLAALIQHAATQLRVKGETFQEVVDNAGRRIPRRYRRDAERIAEVEAMLANPKLTRRVDPKLMTKAERRFRYFLDKQDPKAERLGEILDWVAAVAFIFVVVALGFFFYLISTGYFE